MPEIGMGKGAGAGSFAAGFGRGLSKALLMNRERADQKHKEEQDRKDRLFSATLPILMQNVDDPADLGPYIQQHFPEFFGDKATGGKAKGKSGFDKLMSVLGPFVGMKKQQGIPIESGWPGGPVVLKPGGGVGMDAPESGGIGGMLGRSPGPFGRQPEPGANMPPSQQPTGVTGGTLDRAGEVGGVPTPTAAPGGDIPPGPDITDALAHASELQQAKSPTPPHRTLFGVPILSPEEKIQREAQQKTAAEEAQIQGKVNIATRLFRQGVYKSMSDALAAVGLQPRSTGMLRPQSVAGELPDGTPAFGVFDPTTKQYLSPDTEEPIPGFRPRSTTGSTSMGADREALARATYGKPFAQLTQPQQQDVISRETQLGAQEAGARTQATNAANAGKPLTPAERFDKTRELAADWQKINAPQKEMQRQFSLMQTGLKRFREGDKIGGSQAVLVTFQKILDPQSVVRESEYARSPSGLALMSRLEGFVERLSEGGAGVPDTELSGMVETARQFLAGQEDWNALEKDRITKEAGSIGIPSDRVFGVADAAAKAGGGGGAAGAAGAVPGAGGNAAPAGKPYKDASGKWVIP